MWKIRRFIRNIRNMDKGDVKDKIVLIFWLFLLSMAYLIKGIVVSSGYLVIICFTTICIMLVFYDSSTIGYIETVLWITLAWLVIFLIHIQGSFDYWWYEEHDEFKKAKRK